MDQPLRKDQEWCVDSFRDLESRLNGGARAPFHAIRKQALDRFVELGFPTPKQEEWRYTNVAPIAKKPLKLAARAEGGVAIGELPFLSSAESAPRLVFVNGHFDASASRMPAVPGLRYSSLAAHLSLAGGASAESSLLDKHLARHASYQDQAFVALNTAFLQDGALVLIEKGAAIEDPLEIVFVSSPAASESATYPRILVVAEENSQAAVVELHAGLGSEGYLNAPVTEIVVGESAIVEHYRLQAESASAYHVSTLQVEQKRASVFRTHSFSFGGRLVRNDVSLLLNGEHTESTMNGLTVLEGEQHVDNHTTIDHAQPNCLSHELYKGIYADRSEGVFNGTIIVRPDAQKTNAIQSNQSLLLSNEASIDAKPQLKIWADDVKCTHGATVGQLDEQALFYIRSRGVSEKAARSMLIRAFASEVVSGVRFDYLREALDAALVAKLGGL